jgi:hypothetical protein
MDAGLATGRMVLRRGLTLEHTTLGWKVVAVPILLIRPPAPVRLRSPGSASTR